ncbi:MaoC family dehydratase [Nocardioides sp. AE5]|uniref:MaoC family dehydratase n=1 Tax=Nocardioides sp. AE5 TaxID=2962573 RepID=UPI002880DD62|nr:MaoC family dehydratase [Nocardioides sp. AE5]MDT0203167.1 MaoC family dehydratase [Nocardioides sp. AE5]
MTSSTTVRGPYFDELVVGTTFASAPAVTLTEGMQAVHHSIVGNRIRLLLDHELARRVTGRRPLASPGLVWDISIGQSTAATQFVRANLFYRGLWFHRVPEVGDTLHTTTRVEALKQNSVKPQRPPTGMAVLQISTIDQAGRRVLDYRRCAMLPLGPGSAPTGHQDPLGAAGDLALEELLVPSADWDLSPIRELPGKHFADLAPGMAWEVDGMDVVTGAPDLARLTGNIAKVHHDQRAAGGRRLVYGGHTIGLALHHLTRALPNVVTVAGWHGCDHHGPVHEGDSLRSVVEVESLHPLEGGGGLASLKVSTFAAADPEDRAVLAYRPVVVFA